ncbi:MAG: TraB/GumN family protein [Dysgonamonadaceae bacterium]|nr:TraB/GumN family protein [Dysgonamonadaceae bacterium]
MKRWIFVLALIISAGNLFAQGDYKSGSLLWKISGKDLSKPSYVLGTFHLKQAAYLDQIPGARASFESAEQVIGEVVTSEMMEQAMKMQQKMMMTSDTTYKMLYNETDYQIVDKGLTSIFGGMGLEQLKMLKPSGIQMSILQVLIMKYYPNINPMELLDLYIQKIAVEQQKPVVGLETIDHQIYVLFESSSLQRQADALLCNIKSSEGTGEEEMIKELKELEATYDKADLNELHKIYKKNPCPDSEGDYQLNKARNDAWMGKLPGLMKEKSSFIAVGALHLIGEEGLLNQLEQAGYTVEAVKN